MSKWHAFKEFFGFSDEKDLEEDVSIEPDSSVNSSPAILRTVPNVHETPISKRYTGITEIRIEKPKTYQDCLTVTTYLKENKPCIVNLKYTPSDESERLIDFVCGAAHALDGAMMKLGPNLFLFAPVNVDIVDPSERTVTETAVQQEEKETFFGTGSHG